MTYAIVGRGPEGWVCGGMVEMANMSEVERRLSGLSRTDVVAFSARTCLRAMTLLTGTRDDHLRMVAVLRAGLAASVWSVRPGSELSEASRAAYAMADATAGASGQTEIHALQLYPAGDAAYAVNDPEPERVGKRTLEEASQLFRVAMAPGRRSVEGWIIRLQRASLADLDLLEKNMSSEDIFKENLWLDEHPRGELQSTLAGLISEWANQPRVWHFWRRWYDGMLWGEPLPWDLQEQVALIPDEIWQAGPEALAERIADLEARFEVRRLTDDLERQLSRDISQRLGIGGNNPPEAIDDLPPPVRQETLIIWEPILDLKEQTEVPVPDPARIRRAVSKLIGMLAACGKWFSGKLDAAATEFAKKIGAWGAGGATTLLVAHHLQIEAVIRAAVEWLSVLPAP